MPKTVSHPPTKQIDMSAGAIDRRLRDLAQLHKLGMSVRDVKRIGKAEDLRWKTTVEWRPAAQAPQRSAP
jgi:hypothetical protein